jgi:hypothetical protein
MSSYGAEFRTAANGLAFSGDYPNFVVAEVINCTTPTGGTLLVTGTKTYAVDSPILIACKHTGHYVGVSGLNVSGAGVFSVNIATGSAATVAIVVLTLSKCADIDAAGTHGMQLFDSNGHVTFDSRHRHFLLKSVQGISAATATVTLPASSNRYIIISALGLSKTTISSSPGGWELLTFCRGAQNIDGTTVGLDWCKYKRNFVPFIVGTGTREQFPVLMTGEISL